jgi:tetratricopeptide (TPR) repeat protein
MSATPWTPDGSVIALSETQREAHHQDRSYLTVTGAALVSFTRQAVDAMAGSLPPPARDGRPVTRDAAALIDARTNMLHEIAWTVDPVSLYRVARAELVLANALLTDSSCDHTTRARLLLLASRIADLCGYINAVLGEDAQAERYRLAAVRASASAGSLLRTSVNLTNLALSHIEAGDPRDAFPLFEAARAITPDPPPRLTVLLHAREARAHAQLADATATRTDIENTPLCGNIDEDWLSRTEGKTWLDLGRPERALTHFTALIDDDPHLPIPTRPPHFTATVLLHSVDAQLALREIEAAVQSARRTAGVFDKMPLGLIRRYRHKFAPHRGVPAVRDLLDLLDGHLQP